MTTSKDSVTTVGEFLSQVDAIKQSWFPNEDLNPWYRGQNRAEWGLVPSLFRIRNNYEDIREERLEDEIREEFIVRAPAFSDFRPTGDGDWGWYFLMQHYGAPTRLLDWTDGALLALYFAVKDNRGYFDSAVWVLDPYSLNKRAVGIDEVMPPSADGLSKEDKKTLSRWLPGRFPRKGSGKKIPSKPIAVFPTHIARRISTQRSCFTVHGSEFQGLERLKNSRSPILRKLMIPSFHVPHIKQELMLAGIDEATIFPDLDGLGRAIASEYAVNSDSRPHSGVKTRLAPSKAHPGQVGVFAIEKIRKGEHPFRGENEEIVWFDKKDIQKLRMSTSARKLYRDFALIRGSLLGCPINFNRLTAAWYLKLPKSGVTANVRCDEYFEFTAIKNIAADEELTAEFDPNIKASTPY